jgi:FkbM family methyltransferase
MDLYHHDRPAFTDWVVENNLLHEPFIVIDVGVQGGEHPRWDLLGDQVRVYGFDAISEAIDKLNEKNVRPHRVYRALALGNEDGHRTLYVPANTFGTSFFEAPDLERGERRGEGKPGPRGVEIRRLDTLFDTGEIPLADHIKIDTEGFEQEVLRGGRKYLARSNILCLTAETSFPVTADFHRTQYPLIHNLALDHRLQLFDISFVRYTRPSYIAARARYPWPLADPTRDVPDLDIGQPSTVDALFCRDFVMEDAAPERFQERLPDAVTAPTVDKLIKSIINFELHGLMDCAVEIAEHFRDQLSQRLDIDHARMLLARRPPYARNTADIRACLTMIAGLRERLIKEGEREAYVARINELLATGQVEREAYVAQITQLLETSQAEREAFVARIKELLETGQAEREAYVTRAKDLLEVRHAEREAFVARIKELLEASQATREALQARIHELQAMSLRDSE